MSLLPSHWLTSLDAISVSITFGTPNGRALIKYVTVVVPIDPAQEMIPSTSPASYICMIFFSPASPTTLIASARGSLNTSSCFIPLTSRTSCSETSVQSHGFPQPTLTILTSPPAFFTCSARNLSSVNFVSHIPVTIIFGLFM